MDTSQSQGQNTNTAQPSGLPEENALGDSKAALAFSNMLREGIFNMQNPPMVGGTAQDTQPQDTSKGNPKDTSQNQPQDKSLSDQYPNQKPQQDNQKLDKVLEEISSIKDEIKTILEEDNQQSDNQDNSNGEGK